MNLYSIGGWQSYDVPHWYLAYIEADSEEEARAKLLAELVDDHIETAWGWPADGQPSDFHDPANWTVSIVERPFMFILGGGCR